ncbi:MAG: thioredoxin family protein [Prevotellaceae bacterium]|jgi:small redox-active disulfide protein 2|nr:thioredoxin family protein [Prevotellaceae bacterium]MDD3479709.1 thioredoxin family protein [Paludibacteraceae bacterium]
MTIKVLGTGCAGCKALHETVIKAVAELNLSADVIKEEDLMKIMGYNVMSLPALVIDEKVVSKGKRLSIDEVKSFIINN